MPAKKPLRFFVLTCRDKRSDFRWPLAESLRRHGETTYIWLRRRPVVTDSTGDARTMSMLAFLRYMARLKRDGLTNIYINSTNTSFPGLSALLRFVAPAGLWCLDMHDDLRYNYRGLKRLTTKLAIGVLGLFSDLTFHAAPTLKELFPDSLHLGNASHLLPLKRAKESGNEVLVLASFDERFDFDLMGQVAARCPATLFPLFGQIAQNDPAIAARLKTLTDSHSNILYRGAYDLDSLPKILADYRISFAPYRAHALLTRYIDPLRYYHCLNAGVEVITTAIPQAMSMQNLLHIVNNADECAAALQAITGQGLSKLATYRPITWDQRAAELVALVEASPKLRALYRSACTA